MIRYCPEDGTQIEFTREEPQQCSTCKDWYIPKTQGICLAEAPARSCTKCRGPIDSSNVCQHCGTSYGTEEPTELKLDWPGKNPDPLLPKITLKEPRL